MNLLMPSQSVQSYVVREQEIEVTTSDGQMKVFVAHPLDGGPFPVALLFMDGIGYREQIRANARRFAEAGYYVAAPDLFYRSGEGITVDMAKLMSAGMDSPEGKRFREIVSSVTPAKVESDTEAILGSIRADSAADTSSLVCVGYCMGARMALHIAATRDDMRAAAGIHPGALVTDQPDSPHHDLATVRGEVYFAFAEQDRSATPESIDAFRTAMAEAGVSGLVERLPGTGHGFAMADLPVYNHDACERHYEQTLDLWRRTLAA
jgi:carboxymethylenebutenolidase